jgi:hypothetical protein
MNLPSIADQVIDANLAMRREQRLAAQRWRRERPGGIPVRQRILLALGDGCEHSLAEILERAPGCHPGKVSSLISYMVAQGRIERSGRRNLYRYRLA